jgi:acetyl-CoA carboxylase biotin carboxylase subunit
VQAAKAVDYVGAGTIEFLVDQQRNFYFLEMNTRIQVEHPVTEMVTGIDLVRAQLEIAAGKPLPVKQQDVVQRGWAIECRIYAEDPENDFLPAPGRIETLQVPTGLGVRDDSGVYEGFEVSTFYDPILSKLVAWGASREEATQRMLRALHEYVVIGPTVNIAFHRWALRHPAFVQGDFDTGFIEREFKPAMLRGDDPDDVALIGAAIAATERARTRNGGAGARADSAAPRSRWVEGARREALRG